MEELIQQYIEESENFMQKQANEIVDLNKKLLEAETSRAMDKKSSEDTLCDLINCLDKGQYKQESVVKALRSKDIKLLEKDAEEVTDSWGELEDSFVNHNNIRPSDRKLYERFGLI